MRRSAGILLATLVLLGGATPVFGQFAIGPKFGLSMAKLDIENGDDETERKTGLVAGGFLRFGLSNSISLQPEVAWVEKGAKDSEGGSDITLDIDYLEVPILLRVGFAPGSSVRPFIFAGPYVAFKIGCSFSGEEDGIEVDVECNSGADFLEIKSSDFGASVGGGLEFDMGTGSFFVDARLSHGLSNIAEDSVDSIKNHSFALSAGFAITVGGR